MAGTLRSPWKWEELIVESAVVGGRSRQDGKARWRRRLDGLAADYQYRIGELERDEPESPRIARFVRDLRNLSHLRQFALPVIEGLAAWPERATWGQWLDRFSALAARALGRPERVLRLLAELRPDGRCGPGHDRGGARRAARSPRGPRLGAARAPVRTIVCRHPAPGTRPQLPRRLRPRPRRARRAAAAARGSAPARRRSAPRSTLSSSARTNGGAPSACC